MKTLITIVISLVFVVCGVVVAESVFAKAQEVVTEGAISQEVLAVELLGSAAVAAAGTSDEMVDEAGVFENANDIDVSFYGDGGGDASIRSMAFNEGTTIRSALSMLSKLFKKNIIPSPEISGTVTVSNLYDVSFEEALAAVIGPNKYDMQDNFIKVYTPEEYQQDEGLFENAIIKLYYMTAAEGLNLISPLLSEYGTIAASTAAAVDTEAGEGGDTFALTDTLVVRDFPKNVTNIRNFLKSLDVAPAQILIEVTMLEAKLDETTEFGLDLDALGITPVSTVSAIGGEGVSTSGFASGVAAAATTGLNIGIVSDHFRSFIAALEQITDTTVLANPKILALNKQAGSLLLGERLGYVTITSVSDGGQATQEVKFLESGTRLAFRPYICKNGLIRMEINPKQSEGSTALKGDFVLPEETTTEILTNVMVEDGQTIVLGGLFREKMDLSRSQVPILGDIPFIGEAFKNVNDQSIRNELIILITPHIINNPSDTEGDRRMADVQRMAQKARKDITWMSRAYRGDCQYAKALRYYNDGDKERALCTLNSMWENDRQHLEVDRLRERIIKETQPDYQMDIERMMLGIMEEEESKRWFRRVK